MVHRPTSSSASSAAGRGPTVPARLGAWLLPAAVGAGIVAFLHARDVGEARADDAPTIDIRVTDPPSLAFEATALGRATHALRLVISTTSKRTIQIEPLTFRFRPVRDGVVYPCEEARTRDDRWPSTLDPGGTIALTREVACETPLPGRYDVELRGRPRNGPDSAERTYGTFPLVIAPGANPPVKVPWDESLHAAASGTTEMRPSTDPNKARFVVAMINGSRAKVTLTSVRGIVKVARRGSTVAPCPEHSVDLVFNATLEPGRSQSLTTPLGCNIGADAVYDVDISIANAAGRRVKLATHSIRVGVLPPPPPRPDDTVSPPGKVIGGM